MMESTLPEYDVFGAVRTRTGGSLPGIVPSNTYECADGAAIVVAGNGDAIFQRLMRAIGRDDLANDPALARNEGRAKRVEEIDGAIEAWCRQRPIDEALTALTAADVPVSRIYSVADMAQRPAVPGARDVRAGGAARRHADEGAGRRAQTVRDTRANPLDRAATW